MQGLEQKPYQQSGSENCQLVSPYECETACKGFERENADFVDPSQQERQDAVEQRAVNDEINVKEPEAQNGKAKAEREDERDDEIGRSKDKLIERASLPKRREEILWHS